MFILRLCIQFYDFPILLILTVLCLVLSGVQGDLIKFMADEDVTDSRTSCQPTQIQALLSDAIMPQPFVV